MGKVIWAPSAIDDIDSIAEFIARDSVVRSSLFILKLIESTDSLVDFPKMGRIIPEFNDESKRELLFHSYRIMYQIDNNDILITAVMHSARNIFT